MKKIHLQADWSKKRMPHCHQNSSIPLDITTIEAQVTCNKCKLFKGDLNEQE